MWRDVWQRARAVLRPANVCSVYAEVPTHSLPVKLGAVFSYVSK